MIVGLAGIVGLIVGLLAFQGREWHRQRERAIRRMERRKRRK